GEIVGPVAGALLVTNGLARKLVAIAECPDEIFCLRFVGCQSRVTGEFLCAGRLDEDVLQTHAKANDAVRLALARHGDLCPIKIGSRGGHGAGAPDHDSSKEYPYDRAARTKAYRDRPASLRMPIGHDDASAVPLGNAFSLQTFVRFCGKANFPEIACGGRARAQDRTHRDGVSCD